MPDAKTQIADLTDIEWSGTPTVYYVIASTEGEARALAFSVHLEITRTARVSKNADDLKAALMYKITLGNKVDGKGKDVPFATADVYTPDIESW